MVESGGLENRCVGNPCTEGSNPSPSAVTLADGRILVVHDTGGGEALSVLWHHGSPQTGALLEPLVRAARQRDIRLLS